MFAGLKECLIIDSNAPEVPRMLPGTQQHCGFSVEGEQASFAHCLVQVCSGSLGKEAQGCCQGHVWTAEARGSHQEGRKEAASWTKHLAARPFPPQQLQACSSSGIQAMQSCWDRSQV